MSSGDFSNISLRNIRAYNSNNTYVSNHALLTIDNNGKGVWSHDININTATASTLISNEIFGSTINARRINVSTLVGSTIDTNTLLGNVLYGKNIIGSTVFGSTVIGSSIIGNKFYAAQADVFRLTGSSIIGSSIETHQLCLNTLKCSTIESNDVHVSSLVGHTIVGSTIQTNTLSLNTIACSSIQAYTLRVISTLTGSTIQTDTLCVLRTLTGSTIQTNTLRGSTVQANIVKVASLSGGIVQSDTLIGSTIIGSTFIVLNSLECISTLKVSKLIGSTIQIKHIDGSTITGSTIQTNNLFGSQISTNTLTANDLSANTMTYDTLTGNIINAYDATIDMLFGDTTIANSLDVMSTLTGSTIQTISLNTTFLTGITLQTETLNGDTIFGRTIGADQINVSSLLGSTLEIDVMQVNLLTGSTIQTNTLQFNTINGTSVQTRLLQMSTLSGSTIRTNVVFVSSLSGSTIQTPTLLASSLIGCTILTKQLYVSSLSGSTIQTNQLSASTLSGSTIQTSILYFGSLTGNTIQTDTMLFSSVLGSTIQTPTLLVSSLSGSTIQTSALSVGSLTGSTIQTPILLVSSLSGSTIQTTQLNVSIIAGSTIQMNTMYAALLSGNAIQTNQISTGMLSGNTIQTSDLNVSTITGSTIQVIHLNMNTIIGEAIQTDSLRVRSTLTGSTIQTTHLIASTLTGSTIQTNLLQYSTLVGFTIQATQLNVSSLTGSTIQTPQCNVSTLVGSTIQTNTLQASSMISNAIQTTELSVSSIILTGSTIQTNQLLVSTIMGNIIRTNQLHASTMMGSTIQLNTLYSSTITGTSIQTYNLNYSTLTGNTIQTSIINVDTLTGSTIQASTLQVSTLFGSTATCNNIQTNTLRIMSTLTGSTIQTRLLTGSTIQTNTLLVSSFTASSIIGSIFAVNKILTTDGNKMLVTSATDALQLQYITDLISQAGGTGQSNTWISTQTFSVPPTFSVLSTITAPSFTLGVDSSNQLVQYMSGDSVLNLLNLDNVWNGAATNNINNVFKTNRNDLSYTAASLTTAGIVGSYSTPGTISAVDSVYTIQNTGQVRAVMRVSGFVPTNLTPYSFSITIKCTVAATLSVEQNGIMRSSTYDVGIGYTTIKGSFTVDGSANSIVFIITTTSTQAWSASWTAFQLFAMSGSVNGNMIMYNNVGIGIANPAVQLQVYNGSTSYTTPTVSISDGAADNTGTYGMINLTRPGAVADGKAHLAFIRAGNTVFGMGYASSSNTFSLCPSFTSTAFSTGRGINIDPSGNVGIKTAAPRNALDVNGSVSLGNRLFGSTDASPTGNFWIGLNGTGTEAERLAISLAGNATTGTVSGITLNKPTSMTGDTSTSGKLTVQDVIRFGNYSGGSYDNIQFMRGTGTGQYPNIRCQNNYIAMYVSDVGGWVASSKVGDMVFLVEAEKNIRMGVGGQSLLINSSNDVVASNNLTANCLIINGGGTYQAGCIYSDAAWGMLFRAKVAGTSAIFAWYDSASAEKMRIHSDGNLGIGITKPDYKLDVSGTMHCSGALYVGNNSNGATTMYFGGVIGDAAYDHTVIEQRLVGPSGELSELLLFKGNDPATIAGPDRIRLRAAEILFDTYDAATTDRTAENIRMSVLTNGNVMVHNYLGINTNPSYPLHIYTGIYESYGNLSGIYTQISLQSPGSGGMGGIWRIGQGNSPNSNMYFMASQSRGGMDLCAYIENDNAGQNVMNFTGQHRCAFDTSIDPVQSVGLIACASGSLWSLTEELDNTSQIDHITINESLPEVILSSKAYSPTIFGIVSDTEDTNQTRKTNLAGRFVSIYQNPLGEKHRIFLNSLGEGGIWICNENGPLHNGDLITTSNVPGYGMAQGTGTIMNYTVGKITIDCDFTAPPLPIMCTKKKVILKQVPINITKTSVESTAEIIYDEIHQRYVKKFISKTVTQEVEQTIETNLYDENGIVIGKHNIPQYKMEEVEVEDKDENGNIQQFQKIDSNGVLLTKPAYQLRYLLPNGTIITKEEYVEKIAQHQPVFIAAFVSCCYKTN